MSNNFFSAPVFKTLTAGAYPVTILGYSHTYKPEENKDFMQLVIKFEDGRQQKVTYFPKGYDYMMSNLRQQLQMEQHTFNSGYEFLDATQGKQITVWVSYNEYGINFGLHDNITPKETPTNQAIAANDLAKLLKM